jgi:hypothetical protein
MNSKINGNRPAPDLPQYQSHKKVWAIKIAEIEIHGDGSAIITPVDTDIGSYFTLPGFRERYKGTEEDKGYFVRYEDGYESWSPSKAFEEGYRRYMTPQSQGNEINPDLENRFTYHAPKPGQPEKYLRLREKAKELAYLIEHHCPQCAEKQLAVRQVEMAAFWANAAIARNG